MFGNYHNPNDFWQHRDPHQHMSEDERMAVAIIQCVAFIVIMIVMLLLCALFG
jgi:hypothetical protein